MTEMFQGDVLSLTSEGQGVIRQEGFVVFVPFTVPGDQILYRLIQRKKNFAQGELVKIIKPGPHRTLPLCRYYGVCGGCQLQHLAYLSQLESKRHIVEDAFIRIGKMKDVKVLPVEPAKLHWAYRRHINLKIRPNGQSLIAGYIAIDNTSLLPVEHCPIFIPEDQPAIQEVQALLQNLPSKDFKAGSAILFKTEDDLFILSLHFESKISFNEEIIKNFLKDHSRWMGVSLKNGSKKMTWGTVQTHLEIEGMKFLCSPDVFTQNHPEQSLKIYQHIVRLASQWPDSKILDLYCGIGISSLLLAKQGHSVIGIEYNPESIELAQENAKNNGLMTPQFIQGDVEQILKKRLKKNQSSFVLLNPPRIGISPAVAEEIIRMQPQSIVYVSCMPSTLARDLKIFCMAGYKIDLVQPYDMFPQTSHVETLVHLKKD
jgi:23S rRNA (uracil1939-C5)-methyltransferase